MVHGDRNRAERDRRHGLASAQQPRAANLHNGPLLPIGRAQLGNSARVQVAEQVARGTQYGARVHDNHDLRTACAGRLANNHHNGAFVGARHDLFHGNAAERHSHNLFATEQQVRPRDRDLGPDLALVGRGFRELARLEMCPAVHPRYGCARRRQKQHVPFASRVRCNDN